MGAHFNPAAPIDPRRTGSHRLPLEHAAQAYEIFRSHGATKVLPGPA